MSVAVKKIQGVDSVKVTLNEGRALILLKPGNSVRLADIRRAVEEQGFTPKDAKVKAIGDLNGADGRLEFKVSGSDEVFPVMQTPHAAWGSQAERSNRLVSGLIAAPSDKQPATIQITEVSTAK